VRWERLILLALLLAGCGPPTPAQAPEQIAGHDLGGRRVRIGVESNHPPFNFSDGGGPVGWDYDTCRAICEVLNCVPDFVAASHRDLIEAVAAGEYDMVADGVAITPEREQMADFSIPYMIIRQAIIVRVGETEIVDRASLLAGDGDVGVQMGSINEQAVIELVGRERVRSLDTSELPVQALIAGDVDAVVTDSSAARALVAEYPGQITVLEESLTGEDRLAFAFPPGSSLVTPVNEAIRALQENGTLDLLYTKWWGP